MYRHWADDVGLAPSPNGDSTQRMSRKNRAHLPNGSPKRPRRRLRPGTVSPIDVLVGIGWLNPSTFKAGGKGGSIAWRVSRSTCRACRQP